MSAASKSFRKFAGSGTISSTGISRTCSAMLLRSCTVNLSCLFSERFRISSDYLLKGVVHIAKLVKLFIRSVLSFDVSLCLLCKKLQTSVFGRHKLSEVAESHAAIHIERGKPPASDFNFIHS